MCAEPVDCSSRRWRAAHTCVLGGNLRRVQDSSRTASDVPLEHMRVAVVDDADTQIHDHFDRAIQFVDAALAAGGKVIVHCKVAAHLVTRSHVLL